MATTSAATPRTPSRRRRSRCFNPLPPGNKTLEWVTLASLCTIAVTSVTPWDHDSSSNDVMARRNRILAVIPLSYATSYVLSRVYMTLSLTFKQNPSVQLHRLTGCLCLFYALLCWYKAIFINNQTHNRVFSRLDSIAWYLAYASALVNLVSGISITPQMPPSTTPMNYYRMFPLCILLTLDVMLVRLAIRTFATPPPQAFLSSTMATISGATSGSRTAASLYTWWCAIVLMATFTYNLFVGALTIRTIQLLSSSHQQQPATSSTHDIKQFLYNVFMDPVDINKPSRTLPSGEELHVQEEQVQGRRIGPSWFSWTKHVSILVAFGIVPALIFCQVPLNLALFRATLSYNKTAVAFVLNALDMLCVAVLPTFLLDTTLVLTNRLSKERVKTEVTTAFLLTLAAPFVLAPCVLSARDLGDLDALFHTMLYPWLSPMDAVLASFA